MSAFSDTVAVPALISVLASLRRIVLVAIIIVVIAVLSDRKTAQNHRHRNGTGSHAQFSLHVFPPCCPPPREGELPATQPAFLSDSPSTFIGVMRAVRVRAALAECQSRNRKNYAAPCDSETFVCISCLHLNRTSRLNSCLWVRFQ